MWGAFWPYLEVRRSGESIPNAISQLDADLRSAGSSLSSFPGIPKIESDPTSRAKREVLHEGPPDPEMKYASGRAPLLNEDQMRAPEAITSGVYSGAQSAHSVERHGGSWGTFLYNSLLAEVRVKGLGAEAVSSSGIAAILLNGGRTAHSELRLPIGSPKH